MAQQSGQNGGVWKRHFPAKAREGGPAGVRTEGMVESRGAASGSLAGRFNFSTEGRGGPGFQECSVFWGPARFEPSRR